MFLLLGLRRLALSVVDHALQVPALVIGSKGERTDALPVITAGPGVPTDKRAASSIHLRTDVTGAAAFVVSTGSGWGAPIETVATAAAAALVAAEQASTDAAAAAADASDASTNADGALTAATAAQADADQLRTDFDAQAALLGDLNDIVGPEAPPGSPPTVVAGFQYLIGELTGLPSGEVTTGNTASTDAVNGNDTGLGLDVVNGTTYVFEWFLRVSTSAPTGGARWSVQASGGATGALCLMSTAVVNGSTQSGYTLQLGDWTTEPNGPGSDQVLVHVRALYSCTADGHVSLYIRPESGTATAHAGSAMFYRSVTP